VVDAGKTVDPSLRSFAADEIRSGAIVYFEPYETVHRENIAALVSLRDT
jgi:hypothetical protein